MQTIVTAKAKERTVIEGGETNSWPESSSPIGNSRNVVDKQSGESRDGRRSECSSLMVDNPTQTGVRSLQSVERMLQMVASPVAHRRPLAKMAVGGGALSKRMESLSRPKETLSASLCDLAMEDLGSVFVKGSQLGIKAKFRLWHPNGLGQIKGMAQLREGRNLIVNCVSVFSGPRFPKSFTVQSGMMEGIQLWGFTNNELRLVILDLEVGGITMRQLGFALLVFDGGGIVNNVLGLTNLVLMAMISPIRNCRGTVLRAGALGP